MDYVADGRGGGEGHLGLWVGGGIALRNQASITLSEFETDDGEV